MEESYEVNSPQKEPQLSRMIGTTEAPATVKIYVCEAVSELIA